MTSVTWNVRTSSAFAMLFVCCAIVMWACQPPHDDPAAIGSFGWMHVTDFDGDGHADVLANRLPKHPSSLLGESAVAILPRIGEFGGAETVSQLGHHQASLGDVNADGMPDLVFPHSPDPEDEVIAGIGVILGGEGPPWETQVVELSSPPEEYSVMLLLGLADIGQDGHLDVLTWSPPSFEMWVMVGDGAGAFAQPQVAGRLEEPWKCSPIGPPYPTALGDFDGDGLSDIVFGCSGAIALLRGNDLGRIEWTWEHPTTDVATALVLGDFDGDGQVDVATAHLASGEGPGSGPFSRRDYTSPGRLSVYSGHGTDGLGDPRTYEVGIAPVHLAAADLDDDGADDLLVANLRSATFHVLFSNHGTPRLAGVELEHPGSSIGVGDVDDDGDIDVLVRRSVIVKEFGGEGFRGNDLMLFENLGAGELRYLGTHAFDDGAQ